MKNLISLAKKVMAHVLGWFSNLFVNKIPSHTFRLFFYRYVNRMKVGKNTAIQLYCKFTRFDQITIGNNVAINTDCYLDGRGKIVIKENVSIGKYVHIYTGSHDYDSPYFNYLTNIVTIEKNTWIASDTRILPGVTIGEGAVVAAGSVVTKNVAPYTVVGGVPAKEIKKRKRNIKYKIRYFEFFG